MSEEALIKFPEIESYLKNAEKLLKSTLVKFFSKFSVTVKTVDLIWAKNPFHFSIDTTPPVFLFDLSRIDRGSELSKALLILVYHAIYHHAQLLYAALVTQTQKYSEFSLTLPQSMEQIFVENGSSFVSFSSNGFKFEGKSDGHEFLALCFYAAIIDEVERFLSNMDLNQKIEELALFERQMHHEIYSCFREVINKRTVRIFEKIVKIDFLNKIYEAMVAQFVDKMHKKTHALLSLDLVESKHIQDEIETIFSQIQPLGKEAQAIAFCELILPKMGQI